MKILILNYEYPPLGGGAGIVSKYQAEGLAAKGHAVKVITTWFQGQPAFFTEGNLSIYRINTLRKYVHKSSPIEWIFWIYHTIRFINKNFANTQFDINICHFAVPGGIVGAYLKMKFKLPFIIVSHGQDIPWFFPKQMLKFHIPLYFIIKFVCRRANTLVLLSQHMYDNAKSFLGTSRAPKLKIIPNGCDTARFYPDNSKKSTKFKIIFVGRIVLQKDPMTFLRAIKRISEKINTEIEVVVCGDGPMLKKMKNFVQKNQLNEIVFFKGWVTKEEILIEYQSSHIQVITSLAEAMSIAVLESLSTGLYVISTPVSGNTDVIIDHQNGQFFNFGDDLGLADILLHFYQQKFCKNYLSEDKIVEEFRLQYDWKSIIDKYETLLNNLPNKL